MQLVLSPNSVGASCEITELRTGKVVFLRYGHHLIQGIVIHPNGFGIDRPSIGVGFREMSKHTHVPAQDFLDRVTDKRGIKYLDLPSGKRFRIFTLTRDDQECNYVIEITDWIEVARDWLKESANLELGEKRALLDFLVWFACEGMYAQAYTFLKENYTQQDAEVIHQLF